MQLNAIPESQERGFVYTFDTRHPTKVSLCNLLLTISGVSNDLRLPKHLECVHRSSKSIEDSLGSISFMNKSEQEM